MTKGPYDTDYRAFTFAAIAIGIAFCVFGCCAWFNLSNLIWQITFLIAICVVIFSFDNSGLRNALLKFLFKGKVVFDWFQREDNGWDVITEALKTAIYFLITFYAFLIERKIQVLLWILVVVLNLVLCLRYVWKSELFYKNQVTRCFTVHKSLALTSAVLFLCLNKTIIISFTMWILTVVLVGIFVLFLLIVNRTGKINRIDPLLIIALVAIFSFSSVRSANYVFDYEEPKIYQVEITNKYKKDLMFDKSYRERGFFEIEDWNNESGFLIYPASQIDYNFYKIGDKLEVCQGEGALGGIWYDILTESEKRSDNGTQND